MTVATQQQPINIKALSWTIGSHVILLLLFFLWRYSIPTVTTDIGNGLEVNLGSSADGSGDDQPMNKENPAAYSASVVYKNAEAKSPVKEMMHSNDADAPSVNDPGKTNTTVNNPSRNNTTTPPPVPRAVYGGDNNGRGGNSAQQNKPGGSEGNTTGPGDRGVPGGTPGAANYTGEPGTGGIGHTLVGRDITPKKLEAEFKEGGKVVIHVTVDRDGNIVNKYVKSSSSPELTRIAMDKMAHAKFSKSTGTEPQQFGDVTIIFKAR